MTSHDETQDEPMMDGATDASAGAKRQGKNDQIEADAARDSALEDSAVEDSVRSVRAVGEDRTAESADGK
ncbi:MAG: hypothetical protein V7618_02695 [Rhodoglobus sp.]|uniref:hypothetical protein n=1 Tax=uncultured Salinibacterium sp. TaxID=459274 RepID=UPI0030DD9F61|tara:strand:- start:24276 stop:24485 length:210 start_codon:yes stop_codon:yes gene_type:complete